MVRKISKRGSRVLQGAREALAFARGKAADPAAYRIHDQDELAKLAAMGDSKIDTIETPEVRDWSVAERGLFHRPKKT